MIFTYYRLFWFSLIILVNIYGIFIIIVVNIYDRPFCKRFRTFSERLNYYKVEKREFTTIIMEIYYYYYYYYY